MHGNASRHSVAVVLLSLVLALSLLLPSMLAPQTIQAQDPEIYALVQIPSQEKWATLKAAVECVFNSGGVYAIVGCSQAQLDNLVADGYIIIDECTGSQVYCLTKLTETFKSVPASETAQLQGGPDNFGYEFIDSNESDGPCFNWIDITETGTNTGIHCDDCGVTVPIGFPFEFYGNTYTNVSISSNGFLTFGGEAALWNFINVCIPNTSTPNDAIFAFWDDVYSSCEGSDIYYETRYIGGQRALVVQWVDNRFCCTCDAYRLTFEAVLYENSNSILFQYLNMTGGTRADGRDATIGIENAAGTDGLQYSCNSPTISNSLAILFYIPPQKTNVNCSTSLVEPAPNERRVSPSVPNVLKPAQLSLQYLSITPTQTSANQPVTITTNVVNTGDEGSNYNVALKINGQVEQTKMVAVGPQATQPVKFTVTKSQPGTYDIDIGGQKGSFTITGESGDTAAKPISSGLIAMLVMSFLILGTVAGLIFAFRRPS